jgi:hypothetical protein
MDHDEKNPIEAALEVFVYLPVGIVVDFPRSIPRYIEIGRRRLDQVVHVAGETVPGAGLVAGQVERWHAQTRHTLRALGVPTSGDRSAPDDGAFGSSRRATGEPAASSADRASSAPERAPAPPRPTVVDSGIDPDSLAIPDYDSLSASQVVPRLASLSPDELETIRRYEAGKRSRNTILNKVAQLQAE